VVVVVVAVVDCSMQTVYRRVAVVMVVVVEWSGVEYADCLQKSGSGSDSGSGVEWSGLEYADCFRRVVVVVVLSGVDWIMQTVYRRVVVVVVLSGVDWNIQTISEEWY